jgi:hypothetical protein
MTFLPNERRASPRCAAVPNRSSIEFVAPEGRRRIGAKLVDISRDGALLIADKPMVRAAHLTLRIESPVRTAWVAATVVRFASSREIALHFPHGCPDDLLLAGTVGIDLAYLARDEANETTIDELKDSMIFD